MTMIQRLGGGIGRARSQTYSNQSGWTNARYQRAARKRRNQLANRRAHRG
jgi:hypothetical protein